MIYDQQLSCLDEFQCKAEPSTVLHGPTVVLNIDPANAARLLINMIDTTNHILTLLSENETPSSPAAEVDYNPLS